MAQEFASDNSKTSFFRRLNLSSHKGFFSLLFAILSIGLIVLVYFAVQQQKVYKSRASETNNNICNLATDAVCGNSLLSSRCEAFSLGCCKEVENNCVKNIDANVKCSALPSENLCGRNQYGVDLSNTCEWNTTENQCVDKATPQVACADITTQAACIPPDQCTWFTDTSRCKRVCLRIARQDNCTERNDCEWKDNVCVDKTVSPSIPPTGGTGNVDLNLKLSFQGITTIPKAKTELIVKIKLVDAENREKVKEDSTFTAGDNGIWSGTVSFADVDLSQKYYLLIKGPMHVQKKICATDAADTSDSYYSCQLGNITLQNGVNDFDFSNVKMFVGDLPNPVQNGQVDADDNEKLLDIISLPISQRESEENLNIADFNLDGIVSTQDWSLMLYALQIKSDEK